MAFWDREKDQQQSERKLLPWEEARMVSAEVAAHPEILTPGWYFYKENYLWQGLRPNDSGDGLQKGFDFQSLKTLQQWLGVPVPQDLLTQEETKEPLAQQLQRLRESPPAISDPEEPVSEPATSGRKRSIDIHIKASPKEYQALMERVTKSGMTRTNYLLRCALEAKIRKVPREEEGLPQMQSLLKLLSDLLAETGRQGGMLKMVIKPNIEQRSLHPEEWDALIRATQDQARLKKKIENAMESVNGYFKTHNL